MLIKPLRAKVLISPRGPGYVERATAVMEMRMQTEVTRLLNFIKFVNKIVMNPEEDQCMKDAIFIMLLSLRHCYNPSRKRNVYTLLIMTISLFHANNIISI